MAQGLSQLHLDAALGALTPDASRRATVGGPAPKAVLATLEACDARAKDLAAAVTKAQNEAEAPFDLLSRPIPQLLEA